MPNKSYTCIFAINTRMEHGQSILARALPTFLRLQPLCEQITSRGGPPLNSRSKANLFQPIKGAINRAKDAYSNRFDLSVGIESGLMQTPNSITGYIDLQWCAIFDGNKITIGVS